METLIMTAQLLLGLSILVIVHEFGHFIAARAFGIKVEKFYLFFDAFGVKLFKFKKGDTEYGIGWLPLGGYVKIVGMIDESMDKEFLDKKPESFEFRSKPVWQRMIVILGGIIMNIILGIIIFTFHTFHFGQEYVPISEMKDGIAAGKYGQSLGFKTGDKVLSINGVPLKRADDINNTKLLLEKNVDFKIERQGQISDIILPNDFSKKILNDGAETFIMPRESFTIGKVSPNSGAYDAGLLVGDRILKVDSTPIKYYDNFVDFMDGKKNQLITFLIDRNGTLKTLKIKSNDDAKIGFQAKADFKTEVEHFGFAESFRIGNDRAWGTIWNQIRALKKIVTNEIPAKKSVSSLVGIAKAYGSEWDWFTFWGLTASLSMVLALMNFLPIPVLDGGYLVYLIIEGITGKHVNPKILEVLQYIGFILVMALMVFALYNDLTR
jgi:regulator of sigma E protease